ncbi:MAG: hypothetical protein A2W93_01470 [Bacteroidetes bacterium GWF2_43_63]|nr:MAG: hypothetical protein A2W93_01470 [Bacteroidetes bacterium GWF2_43_63]HBG71348.1 hypothetical protein [Bacteroidales bacterium]HCB60432.1 hypothetical protein [Bacteroidales bacterium]HCY22611.1 hypothetical protein [Bacteroidales bacterium]
MYPASAGLLRNMRLLKVSVIFLVSFFSVITSRAQIAGQTGNEPGFILKREYSFHLIAHSEGMGLGYRWGQRNTVNSGRFIDFDIVNMKHPKEIKMGNVYMFDEARKFVYGKQNYIYLSRIGLGSLKVMNEKPYWGGVDVRRFYCFGASIAMAKPTYLYILDNSTSSYYYDLILQRYNSEEHNLSNIYGRGPFLEGFSESKFYPGAYFKAGVSFEYGPEKSTLRYVEAGITADVFAKKIPIMAFNENKNFFITFYISANFGKRYNP